MHLILVSEMLNVGDGDPLQDVIEAVRFALSKVTEDDEAAKSGMPSCQWSLLMNSIIHSAPERLLDETTW
jgi:hypothetical protein